MSIILPENHLSLTTENDIQNICKPLFEKTDITFFDYFRMFDDGSFYMLSSNRAIVHYACGGEHILVSPVPLNFATSKFHYLIPPNGPYKQLIYDFQNLFNLAYCINFYEVNPGYIDVFCFVSHPNNDEVINFYFNNIPFLENFILYFKDKISNLHSSLGKNKVSLPKHRQLNFNSQNVLQNSTEKKCHTIQLKNKKIILTKREMECLKKLTGGYSAKEIALSLSLSHRTVEDHLQNAKDKLGCSKRSELIQILLNQQKSISNFIVGSA